MPTTDASQANGDLLADLKRGVAFHNADLQPIECLIIEEEFRRPNSGLRVIAATTTLAMGVNTPASTVIIAGLEHPGEEPYSVAEYPWLAAPASSAMPKRGHRNCWLSTLGPSMISRGGMLPGRSEDLKSRFLDSGTDPRCLIVRVLVAAGRSAQQGTTSEEIISFLEASFGAFQAARNREGWQWSRQDLLAALGDLERHRLVQRGTNGRYELMPLGRLFEPNQSRLRWVYRNYFVPELTTGKDETWAFTETTVPYRIGRHNTAWPLPSHALSA